MNKQIVIAALERLKDGTTGVVAATISDCQRVIRELDDDLGWIPVTERKPELITRDPETEYSEAVMILTSGRNVLCGVWNGVKWKAPFGFWGVWDEEVTHWMPKPEPPKEDSK